MHPRPLTVIVLMLAASPVAAEDSGAIRLFAPVPNRPSTVEQAAVEQTPVPQAEAIRLFSPAPRAPIANPSAAPAIRGTLQEAMPRKPQSFPAGGSSADRGWALAPP